MVDVMLLGLSVRYNVDDDGASSCSDSASSDVTVWSTCSSPLPVDHESASLHSPGSSTSTTTTPLNPADISRADALLQSQTGHQPVTDNVRQAASQCSVSEDGNIASSSSSSSLHCISSLSAISSDQPNCLPPSTVIRRDKCRRRIARQTTLARTAIFSTSTPRHYRQRPTRDKMSHSLDEARSVKLRRDASCSTPELSEAGGVLQQNSGSLRDEISEGQRQMAEAGGVFQRISGSLGDVISERRQRAVDGSECCNLASMSLVSQAARHCVQQQPRYSASNRRRQQHVAKHVFTADSSQPQLVSLRRFCDDYRTSCLQQNLNARRRSLDRMLTTHNADQMTVQSPTAQDTNVSSMQGLSNVNEEMDQQAMQLPGTPQDNNDSRRSLDRMLTREVDQLTVQSTQDNPCVSSMQRLSDVTEEMHQVTMQGLSNVTEEMDQVTMQCHDVTGQLSDTPQLHYVDGSTNVITTTTHDHQGPDDQSPNNQHHHDQANQSPGDQCDTSNDDTAPDDPSPDNQCPDEGPDNQGPDDLGPDDLLPDNEGPDNRSPDDRPPDDLIPDNRGADEGMSGVRYDWTVDDMTSGESQNEHLSEVESNVERLTDVDVHTQ